MKLQNNLHSVPKKLVLLQGMDLGKGEIKLFGDRMMLMPVQFFADMTKISGNSPEFAELQYRACRDATMRHYAEMKEKKGMSQKELLGWARDLMGLIGWGDGSFIESDAMHGKDTLEMPNSSVAVEYLKLHGKSDEPVCHMLAGGVAGAANALLGREDMEAQETKCLAKGDKKCVFECRPISKAPKA